MGNPNSSEPSTNKTMRPINANTIPKGATWGIDNLLDDCIIQSESITSEDIVDSTQDQKGAMVSQLTYDKHWTLNLTFLTDQINTNTGELSAAWAETGNTTFEYAGHYWFVNSITYNGSYNQKKSYTLNAERWINYPATQSNG